MLLSGSGVFARVRTGEEGDSAETFEITRFAHDVFPAWRKEGRPDWGGAACARSVPQRSRRHQREAVFVSALKAALWRRQSELFEKCGLLRKNLEAVRTASARENGIVQTFRVFLERWRHRKPLGSADVRLVGRVGSIPSSRQLGSAERKMNGGLAKGERNARLRRWKKLAPFSASFHIDDDVMYQVVILVRGILLVQNRVAFASEPHAAEAVVRALFAILAVGQRVTVTAAEIAKPEVIGGES